MYGRVAKQVLRLGADINAKNDQARTSTACLHASVPLTHCTARICMVLIPWGGVLTLAPWPVEKLRVTLSCGDRIELHGPVWADASGSH